MNDKLLHDKISVLLPGGEVLPVTGGCSLQEISAGVQQRYKAPIVAAVVENNLYELNTAIEPPARVQFLDLTDKEGRRIYQRSLTFLLIAAVADLLPEATVTVEHSLGKGLYCEINKKPGLSAADVTALEQRMRQLVEMDLPLKKRRVSPSEAMEVFRRQGFDDKVTLLDYWPKDYLSLYSIGDVEDTPVSYTHLDVYKRQTLSR